MKLEQTQFEIQTNAIQMYQVFCQDRDMAAKLNNTENKLFKISLSQIKDKLQLQCTPILCLCQDRNIAAKLGLRGKRILKSLRMPELEIGVLLIFSKKK